MNYHPEELLDADALAREFNVHKSTLWRWQRSSTLPLPKPIKLGGGSPRWRRGDVQAWIEQRRKVAA